MVTHTHPHTCPREQQKKHKQADFQAAPDVSEPKAHPQQPQLKDKEKDYLLAPKYSHLVPFTYCSIT